MANYACRIGVIILGPPIPWACKHRVQFTANKRLDELANPFAYTDLDWIKPVVEKVGGGVRCRLEGIRLRGNVCHGVVSVPALQRRMIRGSTRRLRQPNSHHFRYGTRRPHDGPSQRRWSLRHTPRSISTPSPGSPLVL